jgi:hypothetical protein
MIAPWRDEPACIPQPQSHHYRPRNDMQCRRVFWPTQSSARQADGAENERFPDEQGKNSEPPSCARWGFICTAWLGIRLSKWARLGCNLGAAGRSSRDLVAVSPLHRGVSSSGLGEGRHASLLASCNPLGLAPSVTDSPQPTLRDAGCHSDSVPWRWGSSKSELFLPYGSGVRPEKARMPRWSQL